MYKIGQPTTFKAIFDEIQYFGHFRNFTVFREIMVKWVKIGVLYSWGQAGPHIFVFAVVLPKILSKKITPEEE